MNTLTRSKRGRRALVGLFWVVALAPVHASAGGRADVFRAIDSATTDPELRAELRRVCWRESQCLPIGPHTKTVGVDAARRGGQRFHAAAVRAGYLDPERCEAHELGDPIRWSTRGAFGQIAAFTVRYLPACSAPKLLDDPAVAARAAVRHARMLCATHGACSCRDRVRWWVGPGRWADRSFVRRLSSEVSQCGDVHPGRWAWAIGADIVEKLRTQTVARIIREALV